MQLKWFEHSGRNAEGEKFQTSSLIHSNGMLLASIDHPQGDECTYELLVGMQQGFQGNGLLFISLEDAKAMAEEQALVFWEIWSLEQAKRRRRCWLRRIFRRTK